MIEDTLLEKAIEAYFVKSVAKAGGYAYKLINAGAKGFPDRSVMYKGKVFFVELKRPKGGIIGSNQHREKDKLKRLGFNVIYIHNKEEVDIFCKTHLICENGKNE